MYNKGEFDFLAERLLDNAVNEFKESGQYKLFREKLNQMELDCDVMLMENEKEFAFECFELIKEVNTEEKSYIYRKGLLDSVKILKCMKVLS